MHKYLLVLTMASIMALATPSLLERYQDRMLAGEAERLDPAPQIVEAAAPAPRPSLSREVRIPGDAGGHFRTDARMNGRSVPVLVDTGASVVALNETTARRIGVSLLPGDFIHPVQTANGTTQAAPARISEIEIGPIRVRNVDAIVIRDEALGTTLLGNSFLNQVGSFSVENGEMTLRD
ncbi:retropepsin-like aspartic protease family protein [Jiella marina]|uniref:retropepsin-like aspartic protease family protein n=1 Tax=Jiella sp. LLJ827 TaxID=2917712 RepID=UPI002100B684|nr:TIGR02281 family clan AA aspartic protease [Jiella sp. LLJ827]MCQ0990490.1 TIGR02281 family clan AA aspartic protease [Jiella sp. LLJ827]